MRISWQRATVPALLACVFFLAAAALAQEKGKKGAQAGRTVEVTATEFKFDPEEIKAKPGEKLTVKLTNKGKAPHNITFELPGLEVKLQKPLMAGQSGTLAVTAPKKPGKYTYYCPVGKHKDKGMKGTLNVAQ